ncbi:N-acetyltransferase family protein [Enterococcus olivae]
MKFRRATMADLSSIMMIVNEAIELLKKQGSPQWQNGYGPSEEKIVKDIKAHELYVLEEGQVMAIGALVHGIDPVYTAIQEGSWSEDGKSYVSIHRIAVSPKASGRGLAKKMLQSLVEEAERQGIFDVRIDTHQMNVGMQKAIKATGFSFCGRVTFPIPDGERYAYQLKK